MAKEKSNIIFRIPLMHLYEVLRLKKREITSIYFFAIMYGLLQLSIPLGIQAIINFIQAYTFSTSLWVLIGLVVLGVGISGNLQVNQLKIVERINQDIFARYGLEYSYHIPKLDLKSVDKYYLPELVNRFFDTISLQKSLSKLLLDLPTASIQILFGIILLSFYNTIFIIFGLSLLIVLYLILYITSKKGLSTSIEESDYKFKVAAWLEELARTIKTFKFGKGFPFHIQKSDKLMTSYLAARTSHFKVLLIQYWALIAFKIFITASMLIVGAVLAINNQINIGQFVAAEIVILMIMNSVEKFIFSLDPIYDLLTSAEKLGKILDYPIEKNGTIILKPNNKGIDIKVNDLSFHFEHGKPLLKHVSFHIPSGKRVCIMGHEGAGKSILLRLLTGSFSEFSGSILVNDIPINNYKLETLRRETGIILTDQEIFDGTLLENIAMGAEDISLEYLSYLAEVTNFNKYLDNLEDGYDTHLSASGIRLSKSIIQKILLMRALVHQPHLLISENPWTSISRTGREKIQQYLLKDLENTTLVVGTNDEAFARQCDLVIILENGSISKMGKPSEVFLNN